MNWIIDKGRVPSQRSPLGSGFQVSFASKTVLNIGEFIAKCGDSLRELEESAYWLELLVDGAIMPTDKLQSLRSECDELTAIFVTIIKQARDHPAS